MEMNLTATPPSRIPLAVYGGQDYHNIRSQKPTHSFESFVNTYSRQLIYSTPPQADVVESEPDSKILKRKLSKKENRMAQIVSPAAESHVLMSNSNSHSTPSEVPLPTVHQNQHARHIGSVSVDWPRSNTPTLKKTSSHKRSRSHHLTAGDGKIFLAFTARHH